MTSLPRAGGVGGWTLGHGGGEGDGSEGPQPTLLSFSYQHDEILAAGSDKTLVIITLAREGGKRGNGVSGMVGGVLDPPPSPWAGAACISHLLFYI